MNVHLDLRTVVQLHSTVQLSKTASQVHLVGGVRFGCQIGCGVFNEIEGKMRNLCVITNL